MGLSTLRAPSRPFLTMSAPSSPGSSHDDTETDEGDYVRHSCFECGRSSDFQCNICQDFLCADCTLPCEICEKGFCRSCEVHICDYCWKTWCAEHVAGRITRCAECKCRVCDTCVSTCPRCREQVCVSCYSAATATKPLRCDFCASQKKKRMMAFMLGLT